MPSQPPAREAGLRGTVSASTLLAKWKMAWAIDGLPAEVGSAAHCELGISLWCDLLGLLVLWAVSSVPTFASRGVLQFHLLGGPKLSEMNLTLLPPVSVLRPQTLLILVTPHRSSTLQSSGNDILTSLHQCIFS